MKKIVIALLIILALSIYGCGKENTPPSMQREDYGNNAVSQEERVEKYLLESVPEISDYATYIEKESDKEARLYIQIYEKEEVSVNGLESAINCYPVYVGEKWDTHTANWEWFYVSENLDAVYWYDVVDAEVYSLEDWRNGDGYRTGAEIKAELETEPLQEEPSHNLKDVDWEAFQEKLSAEDAETLQRYLPVLTGGEFTWIDRQRDPDNADAYLHIPCQAVIQDIHLDCDQPDTLVSRIAFADVFQSGTQDVVLYLYNIGGHYLILHEENGVIYGIDYPVRWFQELQEDGLYCSSGGAGYQRFYRMTFANGDYTEHLICIWDEGDFYIGDEKQGTTNEEARELFDAWYDTNMQNDVEWHSPF